MNWIYKIYSTTVILLTKVIAQPQRSSASLKKFGIRDLETPSS